MLSLYGVPEEHFEWPESGLVSDVRVGDNNLLAMLRNITESLRCGLQRVSKDASRLFHLFYAIRSSYAASLFPCTGTSSRIKDQLNG
ncbi:unnamed protein product, partial [Vitis vinifera]